MNLLLSKPKAEFSHMLQKKKCTLQYVILKCKYVVFIYVAKFKQSA